MRTIIFAIGVLLAISVMGFSTVSKQEHNTPTEMLTKQDSVLRHVVLFKFKEGTSEASLTQILAAFSELPSKIPQIKSYEWGLNNSPEGLEKGFTHCFFLTFNSEEDRAIYLPHPAHKAFGSILGPHLDDVLVVDYWTK